MSLAQPTDNGCIASQITDGNQNEANHLRDILSNSLELYGYDLREPIEVEGVWGRNKYMAAASEYRTEGTANYIPCDNLGDVITVAKGYKLQAKEDKAGCNGFQFNCKCNSNANYVAHSLIVQTLQTAENWGVGGVDECQQVEADAAADRLESFVESLWSTSVDAYKDNKRLKVGLIASSLLTIGVLLVMTKK